MVKFACVSCTHAPITHEGYWKWVLGILQDFKPEVFIHLGDLYEGKPAKKWPKHLDETWTMMDEHNAVADQIEQINELVPGQKVWLYGNHDDNVFGLSPDRIPEDIRSAIRWEHQKRNSVALDGWKVLPYSHRALHRLGQITFQHGCEANVSAEKNSAYLYGVPYGLYIQGHTHRPIAITQCEERQTPLPYHYANPGCGADWEKMHYMQRCKMGKWGRGMIIGEVSESSVKNRKSTYSSKQWDAELLLHSWASDTKYTVGSVAQKYGIAA